MCSQSVQIFRPGRCPGGRVLQRPGPRQCSIEMIFGGLDVGRWKLGSRRRRRSDFERRHKIPFDDESLHPAPPISLCGERYRGARTQTALKPIRVELLTVNPSEIARQTSEGTDESQLTDNECRCDARTRVTGKLETLHGGPVHLGKRRAG